MNRTYGFEGEAKAKHGEQSYKVSAGRLFLFSVILTCCSSCSLMHSLPVRLVIAIFLKPLLIFTVPLATLVSATQPPEPSKGKAPILGPDGKKRFFIVHGGLFSKDGVTLDDIRKIDRIGRQPGQEGLMCKCFSLYSHLSQIKLLFSIGEVTRAR